MKMFHLNQGLRTVGLGLAFACLGFSLAVATSGDATGRGLGLGNRAITTNCVRTQTAFVTATDLGVVVVGSQFTRQIVVQFGYKPHIFFLSSKDNAPVDLSEGGEVSGKLKDTGPQTFEVRVFDEVYRDIVPPISKTFSITGVDSLQDPNLALQFVNASVLPTAVVSEPYTFTLHANGGKPPYTFEFKFDEDIQGFPAGLALNSETGEIFGKPVIPSPNGVATSFTIFAIDALHAVASRTFSLTVLPGTVSSEFVATGGTFKLNFGKDRSDGLNLTVLLNKTALARANIREASDLKDVPVSLEFGGVPIPPQLVQINVATGEETGKKFPQKFDKNGILKFPDLLTDNGRLKGETIEFQISLNPKTGVLKAHLGGSSMIRTLGANFRTFKDPIIPLKIRIGNTVTTTDTTNDTTSTTAASDVSYDKTDVVKFLYRRRGNVGVGNAIANTKIPPAGLFLITKASGVEVKTGVNTDRLMLKFSGILRGVGGAPLSFNSGDTVQLHLGLECLGQFPATSLKREGSKLSFRNDDTSAGLHNLIIDEKKGTVYFDTLPILPRAMLGEDILNSGTPYVVPIILTVGSPNSLTPAFDGQSSVTLFRRGSHIQNK